MERGQTAKEQTHTLIFEEYFLNEGLAYQIGLTPDGVPGSHLAGEPTFQSCPGRVQ
ncbi:hypothetical protein [Paenibacillus residui]|uniref:Uncharacterized protein n=1 Tax=Paenibacillus residui TaxID=629724 RepID=A0ABW3D9V1_9BACL